jgi:hypothetical protein
MRAFLQEYIPFSTRVRVSMMMVLSYRKRLAGVLSAGVQPLAEIYDTKRKLLHRWCEVKSAVKTGMLK